MSWFTCDPKTLSPQCQRCKSSGFAALVKRGKDYDIFDCRKCGPVVNKRGTQ